MRETCTGARKNELAGISSNHCSTKIISWHAGDAAEYLASENHHIFKKTLHNDSEANRTTKTFCDTCSRRLLHDPDIFNSLDPIDLIMRSNQISLQLISSFCKCDTRCPKSPQTYAVLSPYETIGPDLSPSPGLLASLLALPRNPWQSKVFENTPLIVNVKRKSNKKRCTAKCISSN